MAPLALLALLGVSACSTGAPAPGVAQLDRDNSQIILPAERFGMDWREADRVRHAREVFTDRCLREQGGRNPEAAAWSQDAPAVPEWRYGRWNAPYVSDYGFEGKPWPQGAKAMTETAALIEQQPELLTAMSECETKSDLRVIDDSTEQPGQAPSIVFTASQDSYDKTYADSRVHDIWREVGECVERSGFGVEYENGYATLTYADDWTDEHKRKAEVARASCDDQLTATQRIADIEAGYQQEYIAEHEAEFQAARAEAETMLAKADEIIKNND